MEKNKLKTIYMQLQRATRKKSKLRLNLSGPAGSGKTMSALRMAYGLVEDWTKVAVIDTENGSASLYEHLGEFNAIDLGAPFTPEKYIEAIDICINAGMEAIIIDSSTHEWSGPGGCIEINEKLAQTKFKGNTWSAWSVTTPRHESFLQKVLQCPVHIITCTRSKMETVLTDDKKVKKVGMKDIQREGWEYELTVSLNIDRDTHTATASKDRTEIFEGLDPFVITEATGKLVRDWCEKGIDIMALEREAKEKEIQAAKEKEEQFKKEVAATEKAIKKAKTLEDLKNIYSALSIELKTATVAIKDEMKVKLTPATAVQTEPAA
jgi:flagellar motor switch/type III secretory pathway protein FliN